MFHDETITNTFKAFACSWSIAITCIIVNYSYKTQENNTLNLWEAFMIIQQLFSWVLIFAYVLMWMVTSPSVSTLFFLKLVFLSLSGPGLLSISCYAFYERENMETYIYAFSFFSWWVLFSVSVYSTFKISLEISILVHRRRRKMKLTEHYKSINMRSLSSNSIK